MLEKFGLSNYENKSFMALLKLGMADARTISSASEVPYGRIYDTLDSLKRRGVINEIPGRPKQYTVVEPDIAIESLLEEKQEEVRTLEKQAELAVQDLNKLYERKPADKLVWKAAIGDELYDTYFDLLTEARYEFLAYIELTPHTLKEDEEYLTNYLHLYRKMKVSKIETKVILGLDDLTEIEKIIEERPEFLQILNVSEMRYTSRFHQGFTIIDKEKVILKVVNPMNVNDMLAAIYLWQKPLAKTLRTSFMELWDNATPLKLSLSAE